MEEKLIWKCSAAGIRSLFWGGFVHLSAKVKQQGRNWGNLRVLAMSSTDFKMNLNEYMVTLDKPLGIRFALSLDGKVFVHALQKGVLSFINLLFHLAVDMYEIKTC